LDTIIFGILSNSYFHTDRSVNQENLFLTFSPACPPYREWLVKVEPA